MDNSKYEAVRANITETISLLDELKSKTTQGEWSKISTLSVWVDDEPYGQDGNEEFIIALHNNYLALRQAALDGERYRKAGEVLAFIFESAREELPDLGFFTKTKFDAVMSAFKEAMDGKNDQWIDWGMRDMEDYRQAVEEK